MKQFTEDELKLIEEMAELFYSPGEIAINLQVDPEEFNLQIKVGENQIHNSFYTGWFKGDIELRKSIAQASKNGSSPAQTMMKQFQDKSKAKFYE